MLNKHVHPPAFTFPILGTQHYVSQNHVFLQTGKQNNYPGNLGVTVIVCIQVSQNSECVLISKAFLIKEGPKQFLYWLRQKVNTCTQ